MSVDKVGSIANLTIIAEVETAIKKQKKPDQEEFHGDIVSIGKSEAINTTQIKWAPLFPIGHTQGIYKIDK